MPIALSENKGDRPLGFDMRKAIALLVVWGKEISQCTDNKGDRTLGFSMGKAIALLVIWGKRAIAWKKEAIGMKIFQRAINLGHNS
ncbi:MAG: hypothetical protein EAZ09_02820 [Oscillatoriales cyanobacterium]|nr:MAG: hypothetical protein EAZ18_08585 [Oscillatoriales cyanobacterium]TAH25026.1 MAG: hypothetical protein EAZ09_02820 [Oscillatoriales cyanobacterium]